MGLHCRMVGYGVESRMDVLAWYDGRIRSREQDGWVSMVGW